MDGPNVLGGPHSSPPSWAMKSQAARSARVFDFTYGRTSSPLVSVQFVSLKGALASTR